MPRRSLFSVLPLVLCGFVVVQRPFVLSVAFEGNAAIDSARLRALLRFCREGTPYRPELLRMDLERVEWYYLDEGFLRVTIGEPRLDLQEEPGRGSVVAVRIPVTEGPRYLLGELRIRDARALSPTTLLQMAPLRSGQPYSRSKMKEWRERIAEAYRAMGHIRFEADLREQVRDVVRQVDCELECREGDPYRVRQILVTGDPTVNAAEFKRRLLVGEGGLFNPEMLSLSLQFLNQTRTFQTISDSDVDIRIDDTTHTVDLVFRVVPLKRPS